MPKPATEPRPYVTGHNGLVGGAILRSFEDSSSILTATSEAVDLRSPVATEGFFQEHRPTHVYASAGRVGGIQANIKKPGQFLYDNLMIQTNTLEAGRRYGVDGFVMLGSSCAYPRECKQPMSEDDILSGRLEPTNEGYALAKLVGLKLVETYHQQYGMPAVATMPCNVYGPGDDFSDTQSHVLSALLARFHSAVEDDAPSVVVWGSGTPRREFIHSSDLASACRFLMHHGEHGQTYNIGWGEDIQIRDLAHVIADVTGFDGDITFDTTRPDGMPRKLLDCTKINELGWKPQIGLKDGIASSYAWFRQNVATQAVD